MRKVFIAILAVLFIGGISIGGYYMYTTNSNTRVEPTDTIDSVYTPPPPPPPSPNEISFKSEYGDSFQLELINPTFLNNEQRNYYGDSAPAKLDILWTHHLGTGKTYVGKPVLWSGAGWTGQPLMVIENGQKYLIQGAYDHHLKKINAETGELVWQYKFDDVIKGTGSIWINHNADSLKDRCVILQGSRSGAGLSTKQIPSFRGVSYFTGEELWRMNSVRTRCYSRDVDASALICNDTAYIGLENGIFTVFSPDRDCAYFQDGLFQPEIYKNSDTLFNKTDKKVHGGNLVTEASPSKLGNHIYIASGSGHIWGYNLDSKEIDWDYFIGSDIDGSPIITDDSCILVTVEKQYIKGKGGVLKLDPSKAPKDAAIWYFPTGNQVFASWKGGIIGSASINDQYKDEQTPNMAAFTAIDGFMYVIDTKNMVENDSVLAFDGKTYMPTPKLLFKYDTGESISTPLFVGNRIVAAGYDGIHLFEHNDSLNFRLLDKLPKNFEATPFIDNGRIYVASRDGNLYCFGEAPTPIAQEE
ncbi:MAG: hypothetical protein GY810_02990 [Aureispira sp.]|nr:hypothetical protein [Aureispira sp.]